MGYNPIVCFVLFCFVVLGIKFSSSAGQTSVLLLSCISSRLPSATASGSRSKIEGQVTHLHLLETAFPVLPRAFCTLTRNQPGVTFQGFYLFLSLFFSWNSWKAGLISTHSIYQEHICSLKN